MNWAALAKLLPALIELIRLLVGKIERRAGAQEERDRIKKSTDAFQEHFDEIERGDLDVPTAFDRLRDRAKSSGPDAEAANGNSDPVPPTRPAA